MGAIITNVIKTFYEQFLESLLFAVMFVICYQTIQTEAWKQVLKKAMCDIKQSVQIRKIFLFAFVLSMVLFSTIFCRVYQSNPLEIVWEHWTIFKEYHILHTEPLENTLLFIPYIFCFFWVFPNTCFREKKVTFFRCVWKSLMIGFLSSLAIEVFQLLFRVGTLQFSDMVYNTLGGVIGGIGYYSLHSIKGIYQRKKENEEGQ